ncbi:hypothetical protein [Fervidibacillus albus]|uniref:Uncharacterized protein n=1 Tax=Fervidibacillus albus TaxID=2980026 RepID=A0A9E8LV43_9BACI|nr:hypothetical protein [Fervidibacillus albus]WAA10258.1 hypothetical protein OE104_02660 [Fervidibacillus albus]
MKRKDMYNIAIIGGGSDGANTALFTRKLKKQLCLVVVRTQRNVPF